MKQKEQLRKFFRRDFKKFSLIYYRNFLLYSYTSNYDIKLHLNFFQKKNKSFFLGRGYTKFYKLSYFKYIFFKKSYFLDNNTNLLFDSRNKFFYNYIENIEFSIWNSKLKIIDVKSNVGFLNLNLNYYSFLNLRENFNLNLIHNQLIFINLKIILTETYEFYKIFLFLYYKNFN